MSHTAEPFLVEPGFTSSLATGRGRPRMLFYPDGTIRVEHRCDRGERGTVIAAPALQLESAGHVVQSRFPLTVSPSILCPDCGLHGFVEGDRWRDA